MNEAYQVKGMEEFESWETDEAMICLPVLEDLWEDQLMQLVLVTMLRKQRHIMYMDMVSRPNTCPFGSSNVFSGRVFGRIFST